ncbi:MAG: hypothetical protein KGH59_02475 [Candidatus Micrarchaeota archaeon]|nr:hypothetical protein [Candidatus Micrarchaeota archaeon]MDE1846470.1 hypothetical protein [Candidatus Micrarchaeota archaeon]
MLESNVTEQVKEVKVEDKGTEQPKPPLSPKEQKIAELNSKIEEERKKRLSLIDTARRLKYKLAYKQAELAALSKLTEIKPTERTKSIGYLKRQKERLEFKISTEASSLSAEKDLIRRINEIDEELDKAIKSYKQKKKVELIKGDIEEAIKLIGEQDKKILDSNKVLDLLYDELRSITGYRGERREYKPGERREHKPQKPQEISLADIAIIKDKKNGNGNDTEDDIDFSSN